jgi:valyl-tRNA synthetase
MPIPIKYPIEGTDLAIEVATTRPETMLGDSGIAVNPGDARYTHLVGKEARHPFTNRLVPHPHINADMQLNTSQSPQDCGRYLC